MIGALGILVAIGGFVFLWGMLNYQTMNKMKVQLEELKTTIDDLKEGDASQLKVFQKRYSVKKHDYNQMVNEMPSKLIANLCKLKPVS